MPEVTPGRIVTFYSFKGGTGRTMSLANVATVLAQRNGGISVLAVDWDLEAPGLHHYLGPYLKLPAGDDNVVNQGPGLLEFLTAARDRVSALPIRSGRDDIRVELDKIDLAAYCMATDLPGLHFLKAGRFDATYPSRVSSFEWEKLFELQPEFYSGLADYFASKYAWTLIDSRTGYGDISGICTSLMPDTLVTVFTPNQQSLEGAARMAARAVQYRRASDDVRPLVIYPVVSRVDGGEVKLNDEWRLGSPQGGINEGFQTVFEKVLTESYDLDSCDLTTWFDRSQIPYVSYYSAGEKIAVRLQHSTTINLVGTYRFIAEHLIDRVPPWEVGVGDAVSLTEALEPETPWDWEWATRQRPVLSGVTNLPGFFDARIWLATAKSSARLTDLKGAAEKALINVWPKPIITVGDPGQVVGSVDIELPVVGWTSPSGRGNTPCPACGGQGFDGDPLRQCPRCEGTGWKERFRQRWILRRNGDLLLGQSLNPTDMYRAEWLVLEAKSISVKVASTLLFASRLYANLGVSTRASVCMSFGLGNVQDWRLAERNGTYNLPPQLSSTEVTAILGRISNNLAEITYAPAREILEVFDFYQLDPADHKKWVNDFLAKITGTP